MSNYHNNLLLMDNQGLKSSIAECYIGIKEEEALLGKR